MILIITSLDFVPNLFLQLDRKNRPKDRTALANDTCLIGPKGMIFRIRDQASVNGSLVFAFDDEERTADGASQFGLLSGELKLPQFGWYLHPF